MHAFTIITYTKGIRNRNTTASVTANDQLGTVPRRKPVRFTQEEVQIEVTVILV